MPRTARFLASLGTTRSYFRNALLMPAELAALLLLAGCGNSSAPGAVLSDSRAAGDPVQIKILSNRADLVSGGDVLVEILTSSSAPALRVGLDGRDVSADFARRPNGRYMGFVSGPLGGTAADRHRVTREKS